MIEPPKTGFIFIVVLAKELTRFSDIERPHLPAATMKFENTLPLALDELAMKMLDTRVLFGFELQGVF